jgi:hypothetical protein
MEVWIVLAAIVILILLQISNSILFENVLQPYMESRTTAEGFEDANGEAIDIPGAQKEDQGMVRYMGNSELYDKFYASIYEQITQGSVRTQAEVGLILHEWSDDFTTATAVNYCALAYAVAPLGHPDAAALSVAARPGVAGQEGEEGSGARGERRVNHSSHRMSP